MAFRRSSVRRKFWCLENRRWWSCKCVKFGWCIAKHWSFSRNSFDYAGWITCRILEAVTTVGITSEIAVLMLRMMGLNGPLFLLPMVHGHHWMVPLAWSEWKQSTDWCRLLLTESFHLSWIFKLNTKWWCGKLCSAKSCCRWNSNTRTDLFQFNRYTWFKCEIRNDFVYPNPFSDLVNIEIPSQKTDKETRYILYDVSCKKFVLIPYWKR